MGVFEGMIGLVRNGLRGSLRVWLLLLPTPGSSMTEVYIFLWRKPGSPRGAKRFKVRKILAKVSLGEEIKN